VGVTVLIPATGTNLSTLARLKAELGLTSTPDLTQRIVASTNLVNGPLGITAQPTEASNLTGAITDTTPSLIAGTVTFAGSDADGVPVSEVWDIASDGLTFVGAQVFGALTAITVAGMTVLGGAGNETIIVGVGVEQVPDIVLADLLARASSAIARECRQVFGTEKVAETLDGSGSRLLGLSRMPITTIHSILEDSATVDASEYSIEDAEAGAVYRANGWGRTGGLRMWGTEAYSSGYILPGMGTQRYTVTYTAGYVLPGQSNPTLPGAVEQACLETVKSWWFTRDSDPNITSLKADDIAITYARAQTAADAGSLPTVALGYLRNYRRVYA
jgi:hypothetical protein